MKTFRHILTVLFGAALLLALSVSAFAEKGDTLTLGGVNYLESYENIPNFPIYIVTESPDAKGDVTIPDEIGGIPVRQIGSHAFERDLDLTSVTIGDNVTKIGSSAFGACRFLKSVTFGKQLETVENSAFNGCDMLTSVEFGHAFTRLGSDAFSHCSALESVRFGIGLKEVSSKAFYDCPSLRVIYLPDDMTLSLSNVSDKIEYRPISEDVYRELDDMKGQRMQIQEELRKLEGEIDELTMFLNRIHGKASVFESGVSLPILIGCGTLLVGAALGLLIGKKVFGAKKPDAEASDK